MPASATFKPDSRFAELGPEFADAVRPAEFPKAIIRYRNDRIAARVGLETLDDEEWVAAFARFEPLPGAQAEALALRYHGHQFRSYNPELGDGRGFLYAQAREAGSGRLLDFGTKGSGRTPWSRGGDGRLTLKGGVREVLATELLEALGVPTSKSLSLIETGEDLERSDEPSPTRSAVLVRLSHSHIRFGTFQRLAYFERADLIERLCGYAARHYFPELAALSGSALASALFQAIAAASARLTARWTAAGFVHGVLNSDNMNVTGESFDYGPYRFLPLYDPRFIAAYFDHSGLYAFGRQPEAVFWNLTQLAGCLAMTGEAEPLVEALNDFGQIYQRELALAFLRRLGVKSRGVEADAELTRSTLAFLAEAGRPLGWEPLFFDWFCGSASKARAMAGPRAGLYAGETFDAFHRALDGFEPERPERLVSSVFDRADPVTLIWDQIESLWEPIAEADDWSAFRARLAAIDEARKAYGITEP